MGKQSRRTKIVAACFGIIAGFEGLRLDPYYDQAGVKTVCYGETNGVVQKHYSKAECDAKLDAQITKLADYMLNDVGGKLNDNQMAAVISFTYNVGKGAWVGSSVRGDIVNGNLQSVPNDLMKWNKICKREADQRKVCVPQKGLTNRRQAEVKLWNTPIKTSRPGCSSTSNEP